MQINILQARNNLSRLVAAAGNGEEIVIANRGRPVAKLVAVGSDTKPHTGSQIAAWLKSNPLPTPAIRRDVDLDKQIADEREAWD
ncbi:type II toxin-antitoxin system Phd/YefM family antitoxin [Cryobacterium tepidiphilum]|uniref:Antitoxin n=1 Tax=Cryobacterium tepidiphilum TaxID=2486026 RepID=A0A3M8LCU4_9MICO|nr:type II toxin-antitoxin system prevent-host-death family antitoxin [Cryobacterium tepidiphilum]RNE62308.1 type II toxin-antitoxin system prevent-host-death family antitoxin [Cryobacterium tepidiphilum]